MQTCSGHNAAFGHGAAFGWRSAFSAAIKLPFSEPALAPEVRYSTYPQPPIANLPRKSRR